MSTVIDEAKALQEQIVRDRRWLHQHPELGFDLDETCAYVRGRLEEMGYEVSSPCQGALLAQVGDPAAGPVFMLRADMDALPVQEATGLDFASTNNNMHACGHDTHTAMLLGAAKILKDHEAELKGCVKLLFQPDEEGVAPVEYCGGDAVLEAGVLENPHVDAVAALHVQALEFDAGAIYTRKGTIFSSIDDIDVRITGRGAHGSTPHQGIDPCHIYQGFQNLIAREVDPTQTCVATFGKIESGRAANVIPDSASMLGTLRTQDAGVRQGFKEHAQRMVKSIAEAFGGTATVDFLRGVPNTYNDPAPRSSWAMRTSFSTSPCRSSKRRSPAPTTLPSSPRTPPRPTLSSARARCRGTRAAACTIPTSSSTRRCSGRAPLCLPTARFPI